MGTMMRADNDWYSDPPEATEALLRAETFDGLCWDPACGVGTIPDVLNAAGVTCMGTDLVDRKWRPKNARVYGPHDFLTEQAPAGVLNYVCNPPYKRARAFVERALSLNPAKIAMLLPLTFLEGQERTQWLETTPLARVHVFSWRISMPPGALLHAGAVKPEGGKKAFAWFVFEHGWKGPPQIRFLHRPAAVSAKEAA